MGQAISRPQAIPGKVGYVLETPSRAVTAIHTIFYSMGYEQEIARLAEQILGALRKQLGEYGALVDRDERERMDEVAERLEAARQGTNRELIAKLVEDLNEITTPFAERIMDAAIKLALEKKSVEELA